MPNFKLNQISFSSHLNLYYVELTRKIQLDFLKSYQYN